MESDFLKKHQGLMLVGIILIWYILTVVLDLIWLKDTSFSKLFILKEAVIGMKPIGLPLPETGILLFIVGLFPITFIFYLMTKKLERNQIIKSFFTTLGFSLLIFMLMIPILVAGEVLYIILIGKLCGSISWLEWLKDVLDLFSFTAKIQPSFMNNAITIDLSLGGLLALYIGIPWIRRKMKF